jgi:hypothetical protein
MPKTPNCFVQQLMPINGLTIRPDLMTAHIIHDPGEKMKRIRALAGMSETRGGPARLE